MKKLTDRDKRVAAWQKHRDKYGLRDYRYSTVDTVNMARAFYAGWEARGRASKPKGARR